VVTTVELACDRLTCLVGLHVEHTVAGILDEVRALAARTETFGDHVKLVFPDPLDVIIGARHLDTVVSDCVYVSSIVASRTATEMLREPTTLARDTWAWLVARIGHEPVSGDGVFAIGHHGRILTVPAPDELDDRWPSGRGLVLGVLTRHGARIERVTRAGEIGRGTESMIAIADSSVSRHHIGLEVDELGAWTARDLASSSGFYIAGRHAGSSAVPLHPGLVLQLARPTAVVVLAVT
jgi:hypothetical protein